MTPTVGPREGRQAGNSPIQLLVSQLEGTYYLISEASELTGIPIKTLRHWYRTEKSKAPSEQLVQGGLTVYLYTPSDITELKALRAETTKHEKRKS